MTQAHGAEVARHVSRGAFYATKEITGDTEEHVLHPVIGGLMRTLKHARVPLKDAFRGIGYGIMQGAIETQSDLSESAANAIAGARETARDLGLADEEQAMKDIAEGVLAAIEEMDPKALTQVRVALPQELTEVPHPKGGQEENRSG